MGIMYLEEYTVRDLANLPEGHKFHFLEGQVRGKKAGMSTKQEHDAEHEAQLVFWGCKPDQLGILASRPDAQGVYFADRLYHLMLHLAYWKDTKQTGYRKELVERFEAEANFNLDNLTRPTQSSVVLEYPPRG
jgi:hypothetical protein